MAYIRQEVRGTTGQDINKMNENFMNIWEKVHGDINFSDTDKNTQNKIMTQWLPVQGEGNLDSNYPLYIRFYVPPNTKEVRSSDFNMLCENYRMDSSVTSGGGGVAGGDIQLSLGTATVGVASVSGGGSTAYVDKWGTPPNVVNTPTQNLISNGVVKRDELNFFKNVGGRDDLGVLAIPSIWELMGNKEITLVDLRSLQHEHELPPHSHIIQLSPHGHTGSASIQIPEHNHKLNEGIKVSTTTPQNVFVEINDNAVAHFDGLKPINNQDWTPFINIGQWNTIKVTTTNLARVVIYGTIELLIKNS